LESKEEQIVSLANEYMEYLAELLGEGHEEIVVSLINNVCSIIAEKETKVLGLRYQDEEGNPIEQEEAQELFKSRRGDIGDPGLPEDSIRRRGRKNENFPTLSEEITSDMEDALGLVYNVFEDMGFALESSEGDNEILKMEVERLKKRNDHLSDQAKKLYKLNEYQSVKIQEMEDTIDEIFKNGEELTEDKEGDK